MIVLDCSAAVEMVRETSLGAAFESLILQGEPIITSDLFKAEVRNVFWKYAHAGFLTPEQAEQCIAAALDLVIEFVSLDENADEAFREATRCGHSVYDLFYATLARRHVATLMTADKKLANLCNTLGINCVQEVELDTPSKNFAR